MIEQIAKREKLLLQIFFAFVLASAIWMTASNLSNPLTGSYSFRQTQTALSAYWIAKGGPWLNYETPVLGAPWSIPFEFPLYQLLVAAVSHLGVPLDVAGRLVSFVFFLGCLWPIRMLVLNADLSELTFWRIAVLFVSSPLYVFWGGSFMIESCALFFSLLWLAFLAEFIRYRRARALVTSVLSGCLAALVKITTFLSVGLVGGLATLVIVWLAWRRGQPARQLVETVVGCALIGFVPLILASAWTFYADQVKASNEFGALLTSSRLKAWNFGTLSQRLSADQWFRAVILRTFPHTMGYLWPVAIGVICLGLMRKPYWVLLSCLGFFSLFILFTNLAFVHDYYPYGTAIFILIALAVSLDGIKQERWRAIGVAVIALLAINQVAYANYSYFPLDQSDRDHAVPEYDAAQIVKSRTPKHSSVLVFGEDWSSIVQYLSQRKGLSVWDNAISEDKFHEILENPQKFLGDVPLGAIVICRNGSNRPNRFAEIEKFASEHVTLGVAWGCKVVSPKKNMLVDSKQ